LIGGKSRIDGEETTMTRKIALAIAGGVMGAIVAATLALTLSRGLSDSALAVTRPAKPIVKTETRVVTVTKQRPQRAAGGTSKATQQTSGSMSAPAGDAWSDDDHHEDESGD
jgi:hypothetical protein